MARTLSILALLSTLFVFVGVNCHAQELGPEDGFPITVLVPVTPRLLDSAQNVQPRILKWMEHVAAQAHVHIRFQPAGFDRRLADTQRTPNSCILGLARLPEREATVRWLDVIRRDTIVLISATDDPFTGTIDALMQEADGQIAAPTGIYRTILDGYGVKYANVDDQRAVARMVAVGRIRFGIVIRGTLQAPEVAQLPLRILAELPNHDYWFTCSLNMPDHVASRLVSALSDKKAEQLRKLALDEVWRGDIRGSVPTQ